jgi:hypothetical protein
MALVDAASYSGRVMGAIALAFSMEDRFGDGANLYQYIGSNPWTGSDPMGLFAGAYARWESGGGGSNDPFRMVDEFIAEDMASKAAFLGQVGQGAKAAAYVGLMIVSMLPMPVTSIAADLGLEALEADGEIPPSLVAARKIMGVASLGRLAFTLGKFAVKGVMIAAQYIRKHGMRLLRGAIEWGSGYGLAKKAVQYLARKMKGCGCFSRETLVWTTLGLMPIGDVQVGALVLTLDPQTRAVEAREVTAVIVTPSTPLLIVTLVGGEPIETTDEHPFYVEGRGWTRADRLTPGDAVRTLSGVGVVEAISFESSSTTVHNLTVDGNPSYLVGDDGVWVHNCSYVDHHMLSTFRYNTKRREWFHRAGLDPDNFTLKIPQDLHRKIHPAWNREWEAFQDASPNASALDIMAKMYEMWTKYKLPPGELVRYGRSTR